MLAKPAGHAAPTVSVHPPEPEASQHAAEHGVGVQVVALGRNMANIVQFEAIVREQTKPLQHEPTAQALGEQEVPNPPNV